MAKGKKQVVQVVDESDVGEGSSEEEYEVNKVTKHKRKGMVLQYYVSWLNYGSEEDCWISEESAEGARESVNAYWKTVAPAKQHERFAPGSKEQIKAKAAGAAPSSGKKAPASKSKRALPADEDEDVAEEAVKVKNQTSAKKAANSPEKVPAPKKKRDAKHEPVDSPELDGEGDEESVEVDGRTMFKHEDEYMHLADWEPLVAKVDTVERAADGVLKLLVAWSEDETYSWVASDIIIDFYETHLKFSIKEDGMETDE